MTDQVQALRRMLEAERNAHDKTKVELAEALELVASAERECAEMASRVTFDGMRMEIDES